MDAPLPHQALHTLPFVVRHMSHHRASSVDQTIRPLLNLIVCLQLRRIMRQLLL